jgi:hypothetical protein
MCRKVKRPGQRLAELAEELLWGDPNEFAKLVEGNKFFSEICPRQASA